MSLATLARAVRTAALLATVLLASVGQARAATRLLRFPDVHGDRIVFTYAGDLWTVSTQGGTAARITSGPGLELFAKFSPDGSRIAFTAQYGGDEQVYVMSAGGGAPRQLTFYPAQGPNPDRWGYDNQVYGWTPDGKSILFRSGRDGWTHTECRLYLVAAEGGGARALPMPVAGAGHFSPDGHRIVYSPRWRDFRSEKRYAGGEANDLYLFDLDHPALTQITNDPRVDRDPMWIGEAVYFNSDRDGSFNLYRYDLGTRQTAQVTHYREWDVRWPSADAQGQIVYEQAGELHLYDTRTGADRTLSIEVPADDTTHRPHPVNAADHIEGHALSPGGERVAIVARGDVFTVPIEHGVTRNITHSSDAHEREVAWSADGKRIAYISDRSGEEELYVQIQDGSAPPTAVTQGDRARYSAPRFSPDDQHIAVADQTGRLYVIDLKSRERTTVAKDPYDLALDYQWSPDGRWLAYVLADEAGTASIYVWSLNEKRSHRVTPLLFNAYTPAWSPDGSLLYFLSAREYQPIMSSVEFNFATDRQIGIFALALRANGANPFGIRDAEPGAPAALKPGAPGAPSAATPSAGDAAPGDAAPGDAASGDATAADAAHKPATKKPKMRVDIDFAGIEQRAIRVPLEPDNLSALRVSAQTLLYQRNGPTYYGRDSSMKPTVMAYSIKDREAKPVVGDVIAWSVTADGKHVLAQLASKEFKYYEVGGKSDAAQSVSLAGLATTRVPAQEWHQIFAEVWRRYRDYFYVENMHGFDWPALRRRYEPLVDSVQHRSDLNYVIAEMIAELTVQHAYIEGGDLGLPPRPFVALPGARFELDERAHRYRIAKIFTGQNEEPEYRSPLTEVGVGVHVGDYVLAINGRELEAGTDPYELLVAPANQPVEWRIASRPDGSDARSIRYQPLSSENSLRYLEWVSARRARVDELSHGRLAYIHLPDMADAGLREFIKWWYPQVRREGIIVDARDNGGGNVSQMLIERLALTLHGGSYARNYDAMQTYPSVVQTGPKIALINEGTGSDGDIFANAFREWRLGPLVGKRTWGGVVGITDHGPLLDGGIVYVPEFATADAQGHWIIEGHGVDPDIEVEQDPVAVLAGHDPQLERAVTEAMRLLPATPQHLPPPPAAPIKTPHRASSS